MRAKACFLLFCFMLLLFTPGCSQVNQLNERLIVNGIGVDIEDGAYVVSVTIGEGTITDQYAVNGIAAPERADYTFAGWATSPDAEVLCSAAELGNIAPGTTLYVVWTVAEAE